jgi:phenylpropionate dioxygenase-like ring-hydroxylating dioxygenase large terminal subunit
VIAPCNWFQHWENVMDPYHVAILHSAFSAIQFVPEMAQMPEVSFEQSPLGVLSTQVRMGKTVPGERAPELKMQGMLVIIVLEGTRFRAVE